jgi:carboxyl-terminal processing protease
MLVIATGPGLRDFLIYSVIEGSPAHEAGLKPGDEIRRINWVPASFLTLSSIINRLQKPSGKRLRIVVRRDKERIKTSFVLRDLI